jgi:hypothetical protein
MLLNVKSFIEDLMSNLKTTIDPSVDRDRILKEILPTIQKNCDISNAHHSGLYSLCGLFLRLKDQYNWEQNNPPWNPTDKDHFLTWIDDKETLWLNYMDSPYESITIDGHTYKYLNNHAINKHLLPAGLYYGSGYGRGLKPTFFLGTIREKRLLRGFNIIFLERELACDLSLTPALRQGKTIVIRLDPLRFYLWSKIQEMDQLEREGTDLALFHYGWNPSHSPDIQLELIVQSEVETILFHELGEAKDRSIPQGLWRSLLVHFPFSRIELYLRTLKDLLADTHSEGTLKYIIKQKKAGSLGFYLSNLKGLRRSLFPEIVTAIREFKVHDNWAGIEQARKEGRERLVLQARRIRSLAETSMPTQPEKFTDRFEQEFFKPLGL